jgi:hypothetical protein
MEQKMKKVIYIVEDKIGELISSQNQRIIDTKADFISNRKGETQAKHGTLSAAPIAGAIVTTALRLNPTFGLLSAIAMAAPLLLASKSEEKSPDKSAKNILDDDHTQKELAEFISENGMTLSEAISSNLKFPPGHPFVGQTYRLHPLADLKGNKKANVYIPNEQYDELILAERESELFRLLVDLGATKITISEKRDTTHSSKFTAAANGGNVVTSGGAEVSLSNQNEAELVNSREYELMGKKWTTGDAIDRADYGWLHFEPSWESLLFAREVGGCLKAGLEIKEKTSFSFDRNVSVEFKSKLVQGSASAGTDSSSSQGRIYSVKAEFAPFITKNAPTNAN